MVLSPATDLPLSEADRLCVARMIWMALPQFYQALPVPQDAALSMIAAETEVSGTECFAPLVAVDGGQIAGVICSYSLAEIQARRQSSMLHFLRHLDRDGRREFGQSLARSNLSAPDLTETSGQYIARIAVDPTRRGTPLASWMFHQFAARLPDDPVSLLVDRQNSRAVAFYRKLGFRMLDNSDDLRMIAMRREPDFT